MKLADAKGIEAVSLRNVGSALRAGPMRLYGYVETKEELLELMIDEVYGEVMAEGPLHKRGWRKALKEIAHRFLDVSRVHDWFVDLSAGRQRIGPNALAFIEASLRTISQEAGFKKIDDALQALRVLNAYVVGSLQSEAGELRAEKLTGLNETEWRASHYSYLERMLATGKFPMVAKLVHDAPEVSSDVEFERGLEIVLDGIAARMTERVS